jgi:hypothetical protein
MKNITSIFLTFCFSIIVIVLFVEHAVAQINQVEAALVDPKDRNLVYLFTDTQYYRYNWSADKADTGYPKTTTTHWKGVPAKVDAALNHPTDKNIVYLFSGTQYYRYNWSADKVDSGFPKSIASAWKGVPAKVDAALNHPTDKNIVYLFSGTQYYRYNWSADKVDSGFPKSIASAWKGVPSSIDAALHHPTDKNIVYLFSGNQYYRYNWSADRVDSGFPKNISQHWKISPTTNQRLTDDSRKKDILIAVKCQEKVVPFSKNKNQVSSLSTQEKASLKEIVGKDIINGYAVNAYNGGNTQRISLDILFFETRDEIYFCFGGSSKPSLENGPEIGSFGSNLCPPTPLPDFDLAIGHPCWGFLANYFYQNLKGRFNYNGKKVIVTGHSQGGAVGAYFTLLMMKNNILDKSKPHRLITLSAPRYAPPSLRVVFNTLGVTKTPNLTADALETYGDPVTLAWKIPVINGDVLPFGMIHTYTPPSTPFNPFELHFCCGFLKKLAEDLNK